MTLAADLLARLLALGATVTVSGGGLRCSAPKGVLTPALRDELARLKPEIIALLERGGSPPTPTPTRTARDGDVPLSFAQQRLWFLDQLEPGRSTYTIAGRRRLRGLLDVAALERALTELIRRHESLRTVFVSSDGEPRQHILSPGPVRLETINLETVPAAARDALVDDHVQEAVRRPFSLTRGPLFRPVLLRLAPDEHELVLSIHHIVADGWSLGLISRELEALYRGYTIGGALPLPEPPLQYADYAFWQRRWLVGEVLEPHRAYWRTKLAALPPPLELLTDHPRDRQSNPVAASHDFTLPRTLADALRQLGRHAGVTPFMTFLAGFKALLARYTGMTDIVLGTPIANRNHIDLESTIGFFANTLVLRTDLAGDPTVRELLGRVRESSLGAYAHQDMPFEKLVEELKPDRQLGQNPLFQITFVYQSGTGGGGVVGFDFVTVGSPFDLTLFVREMSDGTLSGAIEYRRDLFQPETIGRLARHYQTLLEGAAANPDRRLSALPLVDPIELHRLLVEWNATAADYPRDRSIHSLVADQVTATPEAVAVVFDGITLTYRDLDRRANRLAHLLRGLGVTSERPVGLWMERSADTIVAILAILKAGGAYVPLDLAAPPDRIALILRTARIELVLTQARMLPRLPGHRVRSICLDGDQSLLSEQPDSCPPDAICGESLAYVMYTSGSTGEPKGVAVTHRNVVRLVRATNYAHFGPDEVMLQLAPLSFDASTFEIWGALLNGGRLVVAPPGVLSVEELGTLLDRHGITTLWLSAGLFHRVVDDRVETLRPLRQLLAGGDVLSVPHVRRALAALPGCRLINGYGPTEGTTFSCCCQITADTDLGRSVPIGRPVANTRVYVLDRHRQPTPIGVPGELWIAGDGLAREYLGRPQLTRERFLMHRISGAVEERLYRSGDMVRWLADGTLEFLGRQDKQVKLRGFRVELGEIETVLTQHPRVKDVSVMARPGPGSDKRLVAYVVADRPVAPGELRDLLRSKLPEYMVPAAFVTLERLPLTPNGKVARDRLPEPEDSRESDTAAAAPHDALERQLVGIWEEVLGVTGIGIRDDFFDLGGHSLLALRLFVRLEQSLGIRLPIATLFQAPTIERFATLIRDGDGRAAGRSLVAIHPTGHRIPLFAIPGVGGNVIGYNDLARLMGPDQPFYALQSVGLDGSEEPLTRIEDIAARFIREVREVQPAGPYQLVGACMGGVVAYEMAQQLRAAGEPVSLLALLESWPPLTASGRLLRPNVHAVLRLILDRIRLYVREFVNLHGRQRIYYLLHRMRAIRQMLGQRDAFRGDRSELHLRLVTQANLDALRRYAPTAYPGRAVLFRAAGRKVASDDDRRLAWQKLAAGGLDISTVPCDDSGTMLREPHVRIVASRLTECLDRGQAPTCRDMHP